MPITTPDSMVEQYSGGEDHFKHVLNVLFIPAIEKAGFKPVPPIAKGAEIIMPEIITNLETADIVLCDMSCLNANVFFEFGIRTSLNKPVCLVKDELTAKVPFDTSPQNHGEYNSLLESWEIDKEIDKLSAHLTESVKSSNGFNTLWKYLGIKFQSDPYNSADGSVDKLDIIMLQLDAMKPKLDSIPHVRRRLKPRTNQTIDEEELKLFIVSRLPENVQIQDIDIDYDVYKITISYTGRWRISQKDILIDKIEDKYGMSAFFKHAPEYLE